MLNFNNIFSATAMYFSQLYVHVIDSGYMCHSCTMGFYFRLVPHQIPFCGLGLYFDHTLML